MPRKRDADMVIDRIEGDVAVVEVGRGEFLEVPAASIGGRARDGAVVRKAPDGALTIDEGATEERRGRVAERARSLFRR